MPRWSWRSRCWRARRRGSRCGCIRWTIPPSSRTSPPSRARPASGCATSWCPRWSRVQDVERACKALDAAGAGQLPLHVLIESPAAVHRAFDIAAHPRVQSLSFGLMDFVSAHGGAIPSDGHGHRGPVHASAGGARQAGDRLGLPCARQGAVAWRGDRIQGHEGAGAPRRRRAAREFGYTRMWSIHPDQIRPILEAFAPSAHEIDTACKLIAEAARADWAPISFEGKLEDRASYRYYWQVLERAHRTGRQLPTEVLGWFARPASLNSTETTSMKTLLATMLIAAAPALALAQASARGQAGRRTRSQAAPAKPQPSWPHRRSKAVEENTPIDDDPTIKLSDADLEMAEGLHRRHPVRAGRHGQGHADEARRHVHGHAPRAIASACTRWKAAPAPSAWKTRSAAPCGCSWATSRC